MNAADLVEWAVCLLPFVAVVLLIVLDPANLRGRD